MVIFLNTKKTTSKIFSNILILSAFAIVILLFSCKKENNFSAITDSLSFSTNKIEFDTIFTQTGSITRNVKIYNNTGQTITISEIYLGKLQSSEFFINVNGVSGAIFKNITIEPNDSIFVFVQTKLKANNVDTLLVHSDSIFFSYNSITSFIPLSAWGQDVIKHSKEVLSQNTFISEGKPHVVIDSLVVPKGITLTLQEGAKLYMHYGANLIVHGTLKIQGSLEKPVIITSDRLESTYSLLPGQWGSIIFTKESSQNELNYAVIKNGINGLIIQGDITNSVDITISNSIFKNMTFNMVNASNANIQAFNTVFANANNYMLLLQGGTYTFNHITLYNEGTLGGRNYVPSILIADYTLTDSIEIPLQKAQFFNSICVGSSVNEIDILSINTPANLAVEFNTCLFKDVYTASINKFYTNIYYYDAKNPLFTNVSNDEFLLDSLSQAQNIGLLQVANNFQLDLLEHNRILDQKPDLGAYEYFYEEKE